MLFWKSPSSGAVWEPRVFLLLCKSELYVLVISIDIFCVEMLVYRSFYFSLNVSVKCCMILLLLIESKSFLDMDRNKCS